MRTTVSSNVKAALAILILFSSFLAAVAGIQHRVIKPNDVVAVTCDEETSLNKQYTITKDGFIVMPYAGAVHIGGLTEETAAARIGQALVSERIVQRASVTCQIVSSTAGLITYSGAIQNAGSMSPKDGLRLSDVVQAAHPMPNANMARVRVVTAAGNQFLVNYTAFDGVDTANNPLLRAGDNIFFDAMPGSSQGVQPVQQGGTPGGQAPVSPPAAQHQLPTPIPQPTHPQQPSQPPFQAPRYVTVMGAVASPQQVPFSEGLTVVGAINAAGGLLKDSDSAHVTVDRKIDGRVHELKENVADVQKGLAGDMALRANDAIEVPKIGHHRGMDNRLKIAGVVILGLILLR